MLSYRCYLRNIVPHEYSKQFKADLIIEGFSDLLLLVHSQLKRRIYIKNKRYLPI